MASTGNVETRAIIKIFVGLGKTPTETLNMIRNSIVKPKCSRALVFKWHGRFRVGRTSIEDDERSGRSPALRPTSVAKVKDMLEKDRRLTVRSISEDLDISTFTVHKILKEDLHMSKVSARWVPRLLNDHEKQIRVERSLEFVQRYQREGDSFLDRIITTDETWLWHYDPESKVQSSVWKTPQTPPPKKARVNKSGGKHMFIFFMDRKGMLLQHRVPAGQTVNGPYYSKVRIILHIMNHSLLRIDKS